MLLNVTEIEFDFDCDDDSITEEELGDNYRNEITIDHLGCWDVEDEDDLVEEISTSSGYCIKALDYHHVLTAF